MRLVRVFGAVAAALIFLVWMAAFPGNHSWRQKLTLLVETPDGKVTGSSVVEVRASFYQRGPAHERNRGPVWSDTGEAAVVEVLPGRFLFALMGDGEELFSGRPRIGSRG